MKLYLLGFSLFTAAFSVAYGENHLQYKEYEVLFTNPECREYAYSAGQNVLSNRGDRLTAKPKNAYCTQNDYNASANRPTSPQHKLIEWIRDPETTEIFFTYLSFSNKIVEQELCRAVRERNVKINFVLDSGTSLSLANELLACRPGNGEASFAPQLYLRGNHGGIGLAHNKIFIINPHAENLSLVFSSGNMSSGVVLHHENWHFLKLSSHTYFAQSHLCVMDAEINSAETATQYRNAVASCRAQSGLEEEDDIKAFFVPGDGDNRGASHTQTERASTVLENAVSEAISISIAAHRFSYPRLNNALAAALAKTNPPSVQLVTDDDIWWAGHGEHGLDNTKDEFEIVKSLQSVGVQAKYLETNQHAQLLHHNKFVIFNMADAENSAVFAGAGNLTKSAFSNNWENFYYIRIPQIVESFNAQYLYLWKLATREDDLPAQDIEPRTH